MKQSDAFSSETKTSILYHPYHHSYPSSPSPWKAHSVCSISSQTIWRFDSQDAISLAPASSKHDPFPDPLTSFSFWRLPAWALCFLFSRMRNCLLERWRHFLQHSLTVGGIAGSRNWKKIECCCRRSWHFSALFARNRELGRPFEPVIVRFEQHGYMLLVIVSDNQLFCRGDIFRSLWCLDAPASGSKNLTTLNWTICVWVFMV